MKRIDFLLAAILFFLCACSSDAEKTPEPPGAIDVNGTKITIRDIQAGGLAQLLTTEQWQTVKQLTLSGNLNDSDFATLRSKASQLTYININGTTLTSIPVGAFSKKMTTGQTKSSLQGVEQNTGWMVAYPDLEEVIIPEGTLFIDDAAFAFCLKLSKLTLPAALKSIRKFAFMNNSSLPSPTLPPNLDSIGGMAFFRSTFPKIEFPVSLKYIGANAFAESQLTSVVIPENVSAMEIDAFAVNIRLTEAKIKAPIHSIPDRIFAGCSSLATVEMNDNTVEIGISSFSGCESLKSITLPSKLKIIRGGAFSFCKTLSQVTLPSGLDSIHSDAFQGCSSLESINFPEGLKSIQYNAFGNCTSLKNVVLPESLEELTSHTFDNCAALEEVYIPHNIKISTIELGSVPSPIFKGCTSLNKISFSPDLVKIPDCLFYQFPALSQLSLPAHIKNIGACAYANCENLTSIHLEHIEKIGKYAFSYLPELERATIGSNSNIPLEIGEYTFTSCEKLKHIEFIGQMDSISRATFWKCSSLEIFEVPEGVTQICSSAFSDCTNLEKLTFPSTLQKIDEGALNGTTNIKELICKATIPPHMENDPTFYISGYSVVKVPAQSVDLYKQTPGWKNISYAIVAMD